MHISLADDLFVCLRRQYRKYIYESSELIQSTVICRDLVTFVPRGIVLVIGRIEVMTINKQVFESKKA